MGIDVGFIVRCKFNNANVLIVASLCSFIKELFRLGIRQTSIESSARFEESKYFHYICIISFICNISIECDRLHMLCSAHLLCLIRLAFYFCWTFIHNAEICQISSQLNHFAGVFFNLTSFSLIMSEGFIDSGP